MIIKNSQLNEETIASINKLIVADINASIAFKLSRIIKEISSILEDKNKMEQTIIARYAEKDENGNIIQSKDKDGNPIQGAVNIIDMASFNSDISDLLNTENDIPYEKIKFEDMKLQTAKVKDLMLLDFLFE
ncbi:MAG: hypothetical protein M0R46_06715 [Candidatus Muirbacterium halophilum]|nr:hypothetical protein [Candidatus Muirbacterium halophilum]